MLTLEFPNISHRQEWEKITKNWIWEKAPWKLFFWDNYNDFLEEIVKDTTNNSKWVNSHLYFLIENQFIIWSVQIRHHINHPLLSSIGGHIWYWIVYKYRWKWYGTKLLHMTLKLLENLPVTDKKVLITCDLDNIGSEKIIQKNWWVFDGIWEFEWKKSKRYFINR